MAEQDRNAADNPLDEVSVPHPMSKKWIPYKHANGIAIYLHQNVTGGPDYVGGEFMVSSIVKGTPEQSLSALTHRSSTTTILGPAAGVDVLSSEGNSQVLHIQLLPPLNSNFWTSLCAPRHAVVKQTISRDQYRIHCLMFTSLPEQEAVQLLQQHRQQQQYQQGVNGQCRNNHHHQHRHRHQHHHHHHHQQQQQHSLQSILQRYTAVSSVVAAVQAHLGLASPCSCCSSSSSAWGLGGRLWRPVLVNVAGGYTISGLEGYEHSQAPPESLVTAILKVDLCGWLSPSSPLQWLYQAARSFGVVDAFLERMLTTVALVKDEVEQQRFMTYPFSLLQDSVADAVNSTPAPLASAAHSRRSSSSGDQQQQQHIHHQQYQQQQEQHHHHPYQQQQGRQQITGQADSHQGVGSPAHIGRQRSWYSWLQSLIGWAPAAAAANSNRDQQQRRKSSRLPMQSGLSEAALGACDALPDGTEDAVVVADGVSAVSSVTSTSSSATEAAVAAAAAAGGGGWGGQGHGADVYEQLVGLDEHGQPITGFCNPSFWSELHQSGGPAPFKVRGSRYLSDHVKVPAGPPAYKLLSVDLVSTPTAVHHVARYLPSVRRCRAASCFVINMMVPTANNVMNLVMTLGSTNHWKYLQPHDGSSSSSGDGSVAGGGTGLANGSNHSAGSSSSDSKLDGDSTSNSRASNADVSNHGSSSSSSRADGSSRGGSWSGFDHALYRFIHASDTERSNIFKMIPHIEVGPWVLKQTVGTTPVIMGRKLETTYHLTHKYMEVDIDVTTCKTAGYIVQSIRGMTTSLVVDLSYLLEGQKPDELPEVLIGAVRFSNIDMSATTPLDTSQEVPYWPLPWTGSRKGHQQAPAAAAAYQ